MIPCRASCAWACPARTGSPAEWQARQTNTNTCTKHERCVERMYSCARYTRYLRNGAVEYAETTGVFLPGAVHAREVPGTRVEKTTKNELEFEKMR